MRGIARYYGTVVALDGVDLDLPPGQIHGLAGPNGAGKTTLLGLLLGLSVADHGTLEVLGQPVRRRLTAPEGVAGFVDGPGLYPSLTARGNLAALSDLRGGRHDDSALDRVLEQVGLRDVAGDRVRGFSLGMRQRLGLAAALLGEPRLLVLDEPANGLDPAGTRDVHAVLRRLADEGTTVLLSSHRMDDLEELCSEVTILAGGRVRFSGPLAKLSSDDQELDYRVRTNDPTAAARIAASIGGVRVTDTGGDDDGDPLVVRTAQAGLDELVAALVGGGVAVRELAPVTSALEAAFLALTEPDTDTASPARGTTDRPETTR